MEVSTTRTAAVRVDRRETRESERDDGRSIVRDVQVQG